MKILKFLCIGFLLLQLLNSCKKDPVADFSYSSPAEVGENVNFTNLSTNSESYLWDFGDKSSSTLDSPAHIFKKPGDYKVTLSVKGDGGSDLMSKSLKITGTTYSIRNGTNLALTNCCSFYFNGSEIVDFYYHGTLTGGEQSDIIITENPQIYCGFTYVNNKFVTAPFLVTENIHNDFPITQYTEVYLLSGKGSMSDSIFRLKPVKLSDLQFIQP